MELERGADPRASIIAIKRSFAVVSGVCSEPSQKGASRPQEGCSSCIIRCRSVLLIKFGKAGVAHGDIKHKREHQVRC